MEGTHNQYRLLSVKNKPSRSEKRITKVYIQTKKSKVKPLEAQLPQKGTQDYSKKPAQKLKAAVKHQKYDTNAVFYPTTQLTERQAQGAYYPGYQYYPQYYMQGVLSYPEIYVPVYGYPIHCLENSYTGKQAVEENSPQELGNSGCPTVASEEDLKNLAGEECEFKVVCNGNVILKESFSEQENEPNTKSAISLSDYEEFILPFTGTEPKSDAIPMPSFLA